MACFVVPDISACFIKIQAANALGIEGLLNAACKAVAKMIEGKSAEEMECILTLEDQFTPEEEEQVGHFIRLQCLLSSPLPIFPSLLIYGFHMCPFTSLPLFFCNLCI
uniref:SKP1 component dimerisation domain-containing protein n=1 Tax=Parascaris equorum TaxID=6256 RepID=A0A914R0V5_PAREQ